MVTALYAGSFDPFTNGHLDILEQASEVFDSVIVGVANNYSKKCLLPVDVRVDAIKKIAEGMDNVKVCSYDYLTVDFAKKNNAEVLIRGIRNSADFEYEVQVANTNKVLNKSIKTIFFTSSPKNNFISSTVVRELVYYGNDISDFVPSAVNNIIKNYV